MIPLVVLGGMAVATAVVLAIFWKEIRAWLARVWEKLPPNIKEQLQGAKAYLEKIESAVKNVFYYYSYNKQTLKWTETVISREVDPQSIPKDIADKMKRHDKLDITEDVEKQLLVTTA